MEDQADFKLLRRYYDAINSKDYTSLSEIFDPAMEWREPSDSPEGGYWQGRDAVLARFKEGIDRWQEGTCISEEFVVAGDRIISLEKVDVRLTGHEDWIRGRLAAVLTIRDGRIAHGRVFWDRNDAFRWVGIEPPKETMD